MKLLKYGFLILICNVSVNLYAGGLSTSDFNYINDLVGGRATGMGGAYTAISDDPSGAYYNPAGIVFAVNNQISLSVNNYKNKEIVMDKTISNYDYTQNVQSFYPSFFGVVQSLGPLKIGITWLTLNNEILDQDEYFKDITVYDDSGQAHPGRFVMNYNITDNTFLFGLTFAMFITDSLSVGLTVYGFKRRKEEILNQLIIHQKESQNNYQAINTYITEEAYGVKLHFGLQWMPIKKVAVGLSCEWGAIISHEYDIQYFSKKESAGDNLDELDSDGNNLVVSLKGTGEYTNSELPIVFRGGVAFFASERFIVSFDAIYHMGNTYYQNNVKDTVNFALGSELYITKSFPVRFGLFTNFANTPVIDETKAGQQMHVDLYGASLSISWETKNSSITIGGFYQYGEGKSQIIGGVIDTQKTYINYYSIALTGSAKY